MIEQRKQRFWQQKLTVEKSLKDLKTKQSGLNKQLDESLRYLGEHQALEVYRAVVQERNDLIKERDGIKRHGDLIENYNKKERELKQQMLTLIGQIENYINDSKSLVSKISDYFESLAKRLYPEAVSGITAEYNSGDNNQVGYDIDVRIESDTSEGINNVKTFCYDLTLLFAGTRHSVGFVFHDSRIFSNVSTAQFVEMFRIINEYFHESDCQYIATINQNQYDGLIQEIGGNEAKVLIEPYITLCLTDEGDDGKLLGITVDLDYEK